MGDLIRNATTNLDKMINDNVADTKSSASSIIISEGAAVALGKALSRFITVPSTSGNTKRPRLRQQHESDIQNKKRKKPVVLIENEEVRKEINERLENKKSYKLLRQKKLKFEQNARVIPDVTTNKELEKSLMEIATTGTVSLFNAIAKAQKTNQNRSKKNKKLDKQKSMVNKQSFMDLMKAGIQKSTAKSLPLNIDKQLKQENEKENEENDQDVENEGQKENIVNGPDEDEQDSEDDDDDQNSGSQRKVTAKWLRDDYLTSGAANKKGEDVNTENSGTHVDEESDEESDEDEMDMDDDNVEDEDDDASIESSE